MNNEEKQIISLSEGKYTLVLEYSVKPQKFYFYALRYDERWRELVGDNMVFAMFQEIVSLRRRLQGYIQKELQTDFIVEGRQIVEQEYHVAYWIDIGRITGVNIHAANVMQAAERACEKHGIHADTIVYVHEKSPAFMLFSMRVTKDFPADNQ